LSFPLQSESQGRNLKQMMTTQHPEADFRDRLTAAAKRVDRILRRVLEVDGRVDASLRQAMEYTLLAPGKRVRGVLVLWSCEAVAGSIHADAETAAAAVEMVHTYSLVHDDLPAMDDDDFRRGRPTCHKAFDEATAVLAGDALLTLAFEILSHDVADAAVAVRLIGELARAAGPAGMIAGQMEDLLAEGRGSGNARRHTGDGAPPANDERLLKRIHTNKTAKMFACAAVMGGLCGRADAERLETLRRYGLKIGLGFQIADDILDVCGSSEQLGKTAGKDVKAGKATYPAIVGLDHSRALAERIATEAIKAVEPIGPGAKLLRQLATALPTRTT